MTRAATDAGVGTIGYSSGTRGSCPLCHERPVSSKRIYGVPVCKKDYNRFANARQLAYVVDALIWVVPIGIVAFLLARTMTQAGYSTVGVRVAASVFGLLTGFVFIMKDGFTGQSPGKRLMGVQARDVASNQPIGFRQSFRRNAVLLWGQVPYAGSVVALVIVITIAVQVAKGYRFGDKYGRTRVIWLKYAQSPVFGGLGLICEQCGYDLTGNASGTCPECGTAVSPHNRARLTAALA